MIAHVYLEGGVLRNAGEYDPPTAGNEVFNFTKHSVSLWCAQHFNYIWHENVISHNLRANLVENVARNYVNRGVALSELIKEGNLGFTHALNNFEFEGGSRFSNYAKRCIRQYMERTIRSRAFRTNQMSLPETSQSL